jgi:hypothetical protein
LGFRLISVASPMNQFPCLDFLARILVLVSMTWWFVVCCFVLLPNSWLEVQKRSFCADTIFPRICVTRL